MKKERNSEDDFIDKLVDDLLDDDLKEEEKLNNSSNSSEEDLNDLNEESDFLEDSDELVDEFNVDEEEKIEKDNGAKQNRNDNLLDDIGVEDPSLTIIEEEEEEKDFTNEIKEFLDINEDLLEEAKNEGKKSVIFDFRDIVEFNIELASELLEKPTSIIEQFEKIIKDKGYDLKFRLKNIPESHNIQISKIRSEHIGKLIVIEGIVRKASEVRPTAKRITFICPTCHRRLIVPQTDVKIKEPEICVCGRKRGFKVQKIDFVDSQRIIVEEPPELIEHTQPQRIAAMLYYDLTDPKFEKLVAPGKRIKISGIVREVFIHLPSGGKSTRFDLNIEAVNIEPVEEDYEDIKVSEEDIVKIKQLANDPDVYKKLVNSIAPSIYGYDEIKLALALQLFGSYRKTAFDGTRIRGDIHILLIGDPGSGKSQLLKYIQKIAPKSRFVSGKGASAAGLTATVTRDEYLRAWSVEAGVLVLASNGIALIDELDKIGKEDVQALYEAMEQQTVSIAKANINATLKAECSILAAANPKYGRFDPYLSIAEQINLPAPLLTRFDLIFTVLDVPDTKKDRAIARHILKTHRIEGAKPEIDLQLLKKWIVYARQNVKPKISEKAAQLIEDYYTKMRSAAIENGKISSIPITTRQLEAIIRLSEACARVRLSNEVSVEDAQRAIHLVESSLKRIGYDPETGKIDVDRITGVSTSQRNKMILVRELIKRLNEEKGMTPVSFSEIAEKLKQEGIDEKELEEIIQKLKRKGDIYEPKNGYYMVMEY